MHKSKLAETCVALNLTIMRQSGVLISHDFFMSLGSKGYVNVVCEVKTSLMVSQTHNYAKLNTYKWMSEGESSWAIG